MGRPSGWDSLAGFPVSPKPCQSGQTPSLHTGCCALLPTLLSSGNSASVLVYLPVLHLILLFVGMLPVSFSVVFYVLLEIVSPSTALFSPAWGLPLPDGGSHAAGGFGTLAGTCVSVCKQPFQCASFLSVFGKSLYYFLW